MRNLGPEDVTELFSKDSSHIICERPVCAIELPTRIHGLESIIVMRHESLDQDGISIYLLASISEPDDRIFFYEGTEVDHERGLPSLEAVRERMDSCIIDRECHC